MDSNGQLQKHLLPAKQPAKVMLCSMFTKFLSEWWATSTNTEYISSPYSRRRQQYLTVCVCFMMACCDFADSTKKLALPMDLVETLFVCILLWAVPETHVWRDLFFASSYSFYAAACVHLNLYPPGFEFMNLVYASTVFLFLIILGTNTSACVFSWVLLGCLNVSWFGVKEWLVWMVITFLLAACGISVDRYFWWNFSIQQAQERLIENASDGRCSLDMLSRTFTDSCARFTKLLQSDDIVGRSLEDFLSPEDRARLAETLSAVAQRQHFTPCLVTLFLHHANQATDIKFVPFSVTYDVLHVCVQLQGESRPLSMERPPIEMSPCYAVVEETEDLMESGSLRSAPLDTFAHTCVARVMPTGAQLAPHLGEGMWGRSAITDVAHSTLGSLSCSMSTVTCSNLSGCSVFDEANTTRAHNALGSPTVTAKGGKSRAEISGTETEGARTLNCQADFGKQDQDSYTNFGNKMVDIAYEHKIANYHYAVDAEAGGSHSINDPSRILFGTALSESTHVLTAPCPMVTQNTCLLPQSVRTVPSDTGKHLVANCHDASTQTVDANSTRALPLTPGQEWAPTADCALPGDGNCPDSVPSPARLPPRLPGRALAMPRQRRIRVRFGTYKCFLAQFRETPPRTMKHLLVEAFRQVNTRAKGCCAWHVATVAFMHSIRDLYALPCDQSFAPHAGWQCTDCLSMNEGEEEDEEAEAPECQECICCGEQRRHGGEPVTRSSTDSGCCGDVS